MNMMLNMVNVPVKEPVKGQVATNISVSYTHLFGENQVKKNVIRLLDRQYV